MSFQICIQINIIYHLKVLKLTRYKLKLTYKYISVTPHPNNGFYYAYDIFTAKEILHFKLYENITFHII